MASVFAQVLWVLTKAGQHVKKNTEYYISHPKEAWEDLVDYAKEHPYEFAFICGTIIGGVLTIVVPLVIGFGPAGPILGSIAAGWQSGIGSVVAGSTFAILQSLSMTGAFTSIGGSLIALGVNTSLSSGLYRLGGSPNKPWFLHRDHIRGYTTISSESGTQMVKRSFTTNSRATYMMIWMMMDSPSDESIRQYALDRLRVRVRIHQGTRVKEGFYEKFDDHEWNCIPSCECTLNVPQPP